ncbi:MAG TPA: Panacea domain-containing protein, partial [Pyrinomonadaceae bacterium]|nr:Panacea domain-containing protein [Pyrinomonadaceae bacterium]
MKKYPDNTEIYALKKSRRREIESLPPIERLKMAKSLQEMTRIVSSKRVQKPRDPNWSIAKGRKVPVKSKFDETKTAQLAGVLLQLRGGRMHYMKLIKLMYLVDRAALLRWGSPITFDNYVSMPHGPVLSSTLDLINEGPTFERETPWHDLIERSTDPYSVRLKTKPNT